MCAQPAKHSPDEGQSSIDRNHAAETQNLTLVLKTACYELSRWFVRDCDRCARVGPQRRVPAPVGADKVRSAGAGRPLRRPYCAITRSMPQGTARKSWASRQPQTPAADRRAQINSHTRRRIQSVRADGRRRELRACHAPPAAIASGEQLETWTSRRTGAPFEAATARHHGGPAARQDRRSSAARHAIPAAQRRVRGSVTSAVGAAYQFVNGERSLVEAGRIGRRDLASIGFCEDGR